MDNATSSLGALPLVVQPLERDIIGRSSLESLPQELLVSIFSHLSLTGLQASAPLSRLAHSCVIQSANKSKDVIKRFLGQLIERLEAARSLPETTRSIRNVLTQLEGQNFTSLRALKDYIPTIRIELINELARLSEQRITELLGGIVPPEGMEDISEISIFRSLTSDAMAIEERLERIRVLQEIANNQAQRGNIDRAMSVFGLETTQFYEMIRGGLLIIRYDALETSGDHNGAIEFALRESRNVYLMGHVLDPLINHFYQLATDRNYNRVKELTLLMSNIEMRDRFLQSNIPLHLVRTVSLEEAITFSESLADHVMKSEALSSLTSELLFGNRGLRPAAEIDRVISIARSIPDRGIRDRSLVEISTEMFRRRNITKAITAFFSRCF